MKTSNVCPKCSCTEIYTDRKSVKREGRSRMQVSSWSVFSIDMYLCSNCGYIEEYMSDEDMKNDKVWNKIRESWK